MDDAGTHDACSLNLLYLKSSFLAMEPADHFISLARLRYVQFAVFVHQLFEEKRQRNTLPLCCLLLRHRNNVARLWFIPGRTRSPNKGFLFLDYMESVLKRTYRQSGGGSITERVQTFILEHCINSIEDKGTACNLTYKKNILKKVITAAESTHDVVVEGLYERLAYYLTSHMDDDLLKEKNRIYRQISFLCSSGNGDKCLSSMNLVVPVQCSLNMLEGDTGCALWPSSLFLSELILSYPMTFSNKFCFEVGSGVGLVGIMLKHVGASKVILTDGDMSTLANMKLNLELNNLASETMASQRTCESPNMVECKHLPWESASESELQTYHPDIILGADIIYDPLYVPHLIRVLSVLLKPLKFCSSEPKAGEMSCCRCTQSTEDTNGDNSQNEAKEAPNAYIATVIRNLETFNYFLRLAAEASLSVLDVTAMMKPKNFLPYMLSYDRSSVHLYKVSFSCI